MLLQKLIRSARQSQTRREKRKGLHLESLERRELMDGCRCRLF